MCHQHSHTRYVVASRCDIYTCHERNINLCHQHTHTRRIDQSRCDTNICHQYVSSTPTHSSSSASMTVCDTPRSCKDSTADYCVVCVSPTHRCPAAGLLMTMLVWWISLRSKAIAVIHSRTTLQHPATPCSTLQHTAARCNTLWWISLRSKAPKI